MNTAGPPARIEEPIAVSQIAVIDPSKSSEPCRTFVVAQNDHGKWVARERRGLIEGVFFTQREAIRFALFETGSRAAAVVIDNSSSMKSC
jgi:hypothetical protein